MKNTEQTRNKTRNRHGIWNIWFCFLLSTFLPFYLSTFIYSATISSQRIGSVDMNRILEEYPDTQKIKDELSSAVNVRKENIKIFQSQIDALETDIKNMEDQLQSYNESQKKLLLEKSEQKNEIIPSPIGVTGNSITTQVDLSSTSTTVVVSTEPVGSISQISSATFTSDISTPQISSPTFTIADIETKKKLLEEQKDDIEKYIADTKYEERIINNKVKKNILGKIYDVIRDISNEEGLTVLVDSSNLVYGEDAQDITDDVIKRLKDERLKLKGRN